MKGQLRTQAMPTKCGRATCRLSRVEQSTPGHGQSAFRSRQRRLLHDRRLLRDSRGRAPGAAPHPKFPDRFGGYDLLCKAGLNGFKRALNCHAHSNVRTAHHSMHLPLTTPEASELLLRRHRRAPRSRDGAGGPSCFPTCSARSC